MVLLFALSAVSQDDESGDYIHYRLGMKYKSEKKYDLALEEFQKTLAAYPDNYNAYMNLAEIHALMSRPRLVIYDCRKALSYNPGWSKAMRALAEAFIQDGQYQKAIGQLQDLQQTCDPAERDSLQMVIDRLSAKVGEQPPSPVPGQAVTAPPKIAPDMAARRAEPAKPAKPPVYHPAGTRQMLNPRAQEVFSAGVRLYGEQKYDEALDYMKQTILAQPGYPGAYYYAGLIRRRQGMNEKAKTNFLKALSYSDLGYNAHFYLGKIYGEEKNYAEAVRHLGAYLQQSDYDAGKEEARALIETYSNALKAEKTAIPPVVDIKSIGENDLRNEIEKTVPDVPSVPIEVRIDSLLSMVIVDTMTPRGAAMLAGTGAFKEGKFDNAIKEFKQVMLKYPTSDVGAHCAYNVGICYMKMRLFPNAENQFQMVLERYPAHLLAAQSQFMKALSYSERKEHARAEQLYRDFILKYPRHQWVCRAYEKLGDSYADMEQQKKAIDAYAQAEGMASDNSDKVVLAYKQGIAFLDLSNPARAMTCFKRAIETGEKNGVAMRVPESYFKAADYCYQQKDYKNAMDFYEQVTRKYPGFQDTPWGLFQIGNIHKNQKEFQKAIDIYKLLISKYPDDYWTRQAQWKMEDAIWEHEYQSVLK
jgi:tetratricopeptide (TPR) repeat protein